MSRKRTLRTLSSTELDVGTKKIKTEVVKTAPETCCVCMEDMEPDEERNCALQCGHKFHSACIWSWYATNLFEDTRCPVCRDPFNHCNHCVYLPTKTSCSDNGRRRFLSGYKMMSIHNMGKTLVETLWEELSKSRKRQQVLNDEIVALNMTLHSFLSGTVFSIH